MKKDPTAHSLGIGSTFGNTNRQAVAAALKTAGIDVRKPKTMEGDYAQIQAFLAELELIK